VNEVRREPLTIESICSPLTVEEFVNEYMGKRPVLLKGPRPLQHLIDKEGVFRLCANPKADVFAGVIDPKGAFHQILIKNDNATHLYATGWSLQVEELHLFLPEFMELSNTVRDGLGIYSSMEMGIMLSQPGKGYSLHYDPNPDTWIFQIFGRKKWTYSKKAAVHRPLAYSLLPRGDKKPSSSSPHYTIDRPDESDLETVILEPGDVFYFVGGTWHAAEAIDECCHVILGSANAPWTDVVYSALTKRLLPNPEWRHIPEDNPARHEHLDSVAKQRLAELRKAVAELTPEELLAAVELGRAEKRKGAYRQK